MSEVSGSLYRSFSLLETEKWPEGRDERLASASTLFIYLFTGLYTRLSIYRLAENRLAIDMTRPAPNACPNNRRLCRFEPATTAPNRRALAGSLDKFRDFLLENIP